MKGVRSIAHIVTCVYCKGKFDRDKVPFEQVSSRRYAHLECAKREKEKAEREMGDKEKLEAYIMKMFGESYINPRVRKQINTYINEYEYTHSGILKALIYFFEIKGNSIDKANGGIGIVPYVYKDAYNYYYSLWLAQQKNEHFKPEEYIPVVREIHIPSPQRNVRKRQLFTFLDEEVAEDE